MESAHSTHGGFKGDYKAPGHKSSTVRGSYSGGGDSAGVGDGLSARSDMDSESLHDFSVNNAVNPVNGNVRQNIKGPRGTKSVKSKGNSFTMC